MLMINEKMNFIRNSKYEYLAKIGSISNYSFQLKDEQHSGILEILVEEVKFPITYDSLIELLLKTTTNVNIEQIKKVIENLIEIEVLYKMSQMNREKIPVCMIVDKEEQETIRQCIQEPDYDVTYFALDNGSKEIVSSDNILYLDDEKKGNKQLEPFEYILLFKKNFSPAIFYKLNKMCLGLNKRFIISYLDGHEGIIIPLLNTKQVGCYNDFELLRESSFHNLLDYQIMKEKFLNGDNPSNSPVLIHFKSLVLQTMLLFKHYTTYTNINYYAYSLDFERLVTTKSRLLKFPKCPSCQTDKNIVNAFI